MSQTRAMIGGAKSLSETRKVKNCERTDFRVNSTGYFICRTVIGESKARADEVIDMLFALSSYAMFDMLGEPGRKPASVRRMLKSTFTATLESARLMSK